MISKSDAVVFSKGGLYLAAPAFIFCILLLLAFGLPTGQGICGSSHSHSGGVYESSGIGNKLAWQLAVQEMFLSVAALYCSATALQR